MQAFPNLSGLFVSSNFCTVIALFSLTRNHPDHVCYTVSYKTHVQETNHPIEAERAIPGNENNRSFVLPCAFIVIRMKNNFILSVLQGGSYVDNRRGTDNSVVAGVCEQLHDGWVYPSFAGDRNCSGVDQSHSGPKTSLADGRS
jgi:hypothetical protein